MIDFYADITNGNLSGVTTFLGLTDAQQIPYGSLNFKTALEAAIVNQHLDIVHIIIALPSFRQSLTAKDFNYISMAILSNQPQLVEELLAIPALYAQQEQFDTTHTLEFLFRDILNAGYIMDGTKSQQRPQLSAQHQQRALLAFAGLKTALRWTTPQALKSACEGKDLPFAKLTLITSSQDLWALMPLPELTDCKQYQQVYYAMDAIVRNKKLAHRMEIDGDAHVTLMNQTLNYTYHGSTIWPMISEMQASFSRFVKESRHVFENILGENNLPDSLLEKVSEDIAHIGETSSDARYFPVHIQAKEPHVVTVAHFLGLCLVADRGNLPHHGVRIFRMAENLSVTLDEAIKPFTLPDENRQISYEELLTLLKNKLLISTEPLDTVSFTPQFSGNCAWSSCAKMMIFATFYFRVYEAALMRDQNEAHARSTAKLVAKACYRAWSCDDQIAYLKDYLQYYQRKECSAYGPNTLLLAKIYLSTKDKKTYQQGIKRLLDESSTLTPTLLAKGYEALLDDAKSNLFKFYDHVGKTRPVWLCDEHLRELCAVLINIYLKLNKMKTIEACQLFIAQASNVTDDVQGLGVIKAIQQQYLTEIPPELAPNKAWLPSQGITMLGNEINKLSLEADDLSNLRKSKPQ
ncbi:MAG: hypothetical protein AB7I18_04495 [Candidatus Berkiella sp.]